MRKIHWRPVLDHPLYWVSSDGRVKTFSSRPRILKPAIDRGYLKVYVGGTKKVHRLVATAFKKPKPGMLEVNHKDADKSNNNHWNLEWTDRLGNMKHCDELGLRSFVSGEKHGMSKLNSDQIREIRSKYRAGSTSYPKIAREYGISISSAHRIVTKQTRKYE